jgi:hypothetical protein
VTSTARKVVGLIAVVIVLVLAMVAWHFTQRPKNPIVTSTGGGDHPDTQNVSDFDQFQQELATRVLKQFGAGSDFSVIVATTAYPLGTLLRATGSVPADLEDCVPPTPPRPFSAQRLFPSYTMSSDTALAANLGSSAIQGLDSAGVNLHHSQSVEYTIADTQIQIMDDKYVEQVTGQGNCGRYISAHPGIRLIRGAVIGKMTFAVKVDNPASVKARLIKIGGFSVNDNPQSSTLSIADNQNEPIVELLSEFGNVGSGPIDSTRRPTPKPIDAIPLPDRSPASVEERPHIFVQMDVQDNTPSGATVVQFLHAGWPSANVESKVERIPTQKMPDTAQVRYFNESDVGIANRCASILRPRYPNVRVVRIGLLSPKGQLEVWLPKIKPTGAEPSVLPK